MINDDENENDHSLSFCSLLVALYVYMYYVCVLRFEICLFDSI